MVTVVGIPPIGTWIIGIPPYWYRNSAILLNAHLIVPNGRVHSQTPQNPVWVTWSKILCSLLFIWENTAL